MRKRFGQALRIGVSPACVTLLAVRRWGAQAPETLAELRLEGSSHPDALGGAVRVVLAEAGCTNWPATIVLADELVRIWQVAPPAGSARSADLEAAAALRFQSLYGDAPGLWHSSSAWDARVPFFCAVPRALLAQLTRVAAERKLALIFITPQFARHWNRWHGALKPGAWFGQLQENALTLGVRHDGRLCAVRALPVPAGAGRDWLVQTLAREALLQGVTAPALLQLCGTPPHAWLTPTKEFHCQVFSTPDGEGALSPAGRLACSGGVA